MTRHDTSRTRGARRHWRALLSAAGAFAVALLLSSSPALALTQQGHAFGFSFGEAATNAEFSKPGDVAVDESTHEVYVVDRGKERVDRFLCGGPSSEPCKFLGSFSVPSPEIVAVENLGGESDGNVYVSSSVPGKEEGFRGTVFKFSPDGSTQLAKLTKTALGEEAFGRIYGLALSRPSAAHPTGELWVEQGFGGAIDRFTAGASSKFIPVPLSFETLGSLREGAFIAPGLAVDSSEQLYVTHGEVEGVLEKEVHKERETEPVREANCAKGPCTVAKLGLVQEEEEDAVTDLIPELLGEGTTGLAVDVTGEGSFGDDVYIDTGKSVTALDPDGSLIQQFGSEESASHFAGLQEGSGVAVDSLTGEIYVVDTAAKTVDVFTREPKGEPKIEEVSASQVSSRSAQLNAKIDPGDIETTYTFQYGTATGFSCAGGPTCEAPIPPRDLGAVFANEPASEHLANLQPGTEYHFRVIASQDEGKVRVASEEGTFTTSAATGELVLPDGRQWELVSPSKALGAAAEPIRQEGGAIQAAADGEAISYVTDAPIEANPEGNRNPEVTQVLSTRKAGGGWTFKDIATPDETSHEPEAEHVNEYRLFSTNLSLSLVFPFPGSREASPLAEPALSPPIEPGEVQEKTPYLRVDAPLVEEPDTAEESNNAAFHAAQQNGETLTNPGYVALITGQDDTTGLPFGNGSHMTVVNANQDLSHVVLSSTEPLTQPAPPRGKPGLYEWHEEGNASGALQFVSQLPSGAPALGVVALGEHGANEANNSRFAISRDGSHVFWTNLPEGTGEFEEVHLYMRDTANGQTIRLDEPEAGITKQFENSEFKGEAKFMTASADGSTVLFTDSRPLTKESGSEEAQTEDSRKADLYECEILETAGRDSCVLSDLTPKPPGGEPAHVLGTVLGAGEEDASQVYFVANGVLTDAANARGEKAAPGGCPNHNAGAAVTPPVGATCNLYLSTREAPGKYRTTFIARISGLDSPDFEAEKGNLGFLTARVSPNGRYLAFMSERSLTGYDNSDVNSDQADEEVYIYDSQANRLACASCNPTGQRPLGVLDKGVETGESEGLIVDRPEIWSTSQAHDDPWLAGSVPGWDQLETKDRAIYQSRYLLDDGRLYFDSPDALVPQDTNGKEDVYEYEPAGIGDCAESSPTFSSKSGGCVSLISSGTSEKESDFLDASTNGRDVFFLTSAQLVNGVEANFSVYDAHECTGESACSSSSQSATNQCESEGCHGSPPAAPSFQAPSSLTPFGSGNLLPTQQALPSTSRKKPATKAQLLASALKSCRKDKNRKKRLTCERQARKRYGPKPAKKASSPKHKGAAKR